MAFTRIQFSLNDTDWYTVPINPIEFDPQDNFESTVQQTVDGEINQQVPHFDSRTKRFTWTGLPQEEPYITMVNTLKSYANRGTIYLKLNRLNFDDSSSRKIRVSNVIVEISSGAGPSTSAYKMKWGKIAVEYSEVPV